MKTPFGGGCLCGAVRYECSAEPLFAVNCHCMDCQRLSGAPYVSVFGVPVAALRVTGELTSFRKVGDSGREVETNLCARCGTRLTSRPDALGGIVNVFATTLDDPGAFTPAADIYVASALPWDVMDPERRDSRRCRRCRADQRCRAVVRQYRAF